MRASAQYVRSAFGRATQLSRARARARTHARTHTRVRCGWPTLRNGNDSLFLCDITCAFDTRDRNGSYVRGQAAYLCAYARGAMRRPPRRGWGRDEIRIGRENRKQPRAVSRRPSSLVERHAIIDRPPMTHERASRLRFDARCYVNNTGSARRITIGLKIERKPARSDENSSIHSLFALGSESRLIAHGPFD